MFSLALKLSTSAADACSVSIEHITHSPIRRWMAGCEWERENSSSPICVFISGLPLMERVEWHIIYSLLELRTPSQMDINSRADYYIWLWQAPHLNWSGASKCLLCCHKPGWFRVSNWIWLARRLFAYVTMRSHSAPAAQIYSSNCVFQ